jgi:histidinol-phosphate aminotransferase
MNVRFEEVYERATRPESREFKPYSVSQGAGFARMHQNECYLSLEQRNALALELSEVLRSSWSGDAGPHMYPDLASDLLRRAYACYLGLQPEAVEVFSGSSEALYTIASGCFKPSASVAFLQPSFSLLAELVQLWGADYVPIELNSQLIVQRESLFSSAVLEADVVILCEPNNPTGTSIPRLWLKEFLDQAQGLVVLDEAYFEFQQARDVESVSFVPQVCERENLVVLRTLSKAWGAAGLRIGALAACPRWVSFFRGLRRPYSIPQPSELLGTYILNTKLELMRQLVSESVSACNEIAAALAKVPGVHVFPSSTNFVLFGSEAALEIEHVARSEKILVRKMGTDLIRVSPWDTQTNQKFVHIVRTVMGS